MPPSVYPFSNNMNLTQMIYVHLRNDIYSLRLVPGEKLSEMKLATQYGCSRIPVREALHQLRLEGCIDSKPQSGSFISYIDCEKLEQVRYVRECLETQIVLNGLKTGVYNHAINKFQDLINQQDNAYRACEFELTHRLDDAFHNLLLELPHKEFVKDYMGVNNVHYQRARFLALKYDANPHLLIQQHQTILDAISSKDEHTLALAIHVHLNNLYRVIQSAPSDIRQYLTADVGSHS